MLAIPRMLGVPPCVDARLRLASSSGEALRLHDSLPLRLFAMRILRRALFSTPPLTALALRDARRFALRGARLRSSPLRAPWLRRASLHGSATPTTSSMAPARILQCASLWMCLKTV
jgi:hypothetical protein